MNIQVFYSWLKVFLASVLTAFLTILVSTHDLPADGEAWKGILIAGLVSVVPVIINWLNPNYTMYGKNKTGAE